MQTAEIYLHDKDFANQLKEMRIWLDGRRYHPSSFAYRQLDAGAAIRVAFEDGTEAREFATRFSATLLPGGPAAISADAPRDNRDDRPRSARESSQWPESSQSPRASG